jgi:hypothetical protein
VAQPQGVDQITAGMRPLSLDYLKISGNSKGAGTYSDYFLQAGYPGAIGQANAEAGKELWLTNVQGMSTVQSGLILYDRLAHWGGAIGNINTAQNFGAVALPRYTNGEGVVAFVEFYSATGATATTLTVNYLDTTDTVRSVTLTMPTSPTIAQMVPVPLIAGNLGIKAPISVQLSASTGTAGNFGITLMRRLAKWGAIPNQGFNLDWLALGMPKIWDDACLGIMGLMSGTATGGLDLAFDFCDV